MLHLITFTRLNTGAKQLFLERKGAPINTLQKSNYKHETPPQINRFALLNLTREYNFRYQGPSTGRSLILFKKKENSP